MCVLRISFVCAGRIRAKLGKTMYLQVAACRTVYKSNASAYIVLNFTWDWTETDCWNGIRDHFKRSATRKSAREPYEHIWNFRCSSLFCDTREVRCRFVEVGEKLLHRGELYYIQSALPETLHFPRLFWICVVEVAHGKNVFREFRSILKFELTYEYGNDKFARFVQKLHLYN